MRESQRDMRRRGEGHVEMETETGARCGHRPRNGWSHRKLEEGRKVSPRAFRGRTAILIPEFQTSGLQAVVLSCSVCGICHSNHMILTQGGTNQDTKTHDP